MTHIDDENIKKIIKNNVSKREIKLDSGEIIARFHAEKQDLDVKPRRFSSLQLRVGLSFLSAFLVIGSFMYLAKAFALFSRDPSESSSVIGSSDEQFGDKVADGKEGEFIFMVTSALLYAEDESAKLPLAPRLKFDYSLLSFEQSNLEATLDKTLPLIEQFYAARKGYKYKNHRDGNYQGKHGTYSHEYIVNDTIRIVVNVEIDDDNTAEETEIIGELIVNELSYRISGEKQRDKQKGEMNFALKIAYSDVAYLQVFSKNSRDEQTFSYYLVLDDEEVFFAEIAGQRGGPKNHRSVGVDVVHAGISYYFEIEYRAEKFFIEYANYRITAIKNENNTYDYFYEISQ